MSELDSLESDVLQRSLHFAGSKLRILRLLLEVGKGWSPYHQYSVAAPENQSITLCTLFPYDGAVHPRLKLIQGDGSIRGYVRLLRQTLDAGQFDLVHAHTPHVGSLYLLASQLSNSENLPMVYTFHSSYPNYSLRNKLLLVPIFARFDRIVCCGDASLESLPWRYRALAGARLSAVANGVDLDHIDSVLDKSSWNTRSSSERPFTVVMVGRLITIKNPLTVLDAFARLDDSTARLVVVGDGDLRDVAAKRASDLGIRDRVEFTGLVSREEVFGQLVQADVCVSASYGEGLPNAVLEAMACRCPVILSDIPSHREIAGDEGVVALFPPSDCSALAREMDRFQVLTCDRKRSLGARCRDIVEQRFTLGRMHIEYESIYQGLLEEKVAAKDDCASAATGT